jgi:hypothetical protein
LQQEVRLTWVGVSVVAIGVFSLGLVTLALHGRVSDLEVALSRAELNPSSVPAEKDGAAKRTPRTGAGLRARLELFAKEFPLKTEEIEEVHEVMSTVYRRTDELGAALRAGDLSQSEMRAGVKEARQRAELDLDALLGESRFAQLRRFMSSPDGRGPEAGAKEEGIE